MKLKEYKEIYERKQSEEIPLNDLQRLSRIKRLTENSEVTTREFISKTEAIEELHNLEVLLKWCYAGYDYFNKDGALNNILKKTESIFIDKEISVSEYMMLICMNLRRIIKDNHVYFKYNDNYVYFNINYSPYFSNIIVKREEDMYCVVNKNECFEIGHKFSENEIGEFLFKTLPDDGQEKYLVGKLLEVESLNKNIKICEKTIELHLSKSVANTQVDDNGMILEYERFNILFNNSFSFPNEKELLDIYYGFGKKLSEKESAVWCLLDNIGGSSLFPDRVIKGLNDYSFWAIRSAVMHIPYLYKESAKKYDNYENISTNQHEGTYNGTLYVLMNKRTASSGEAAIAMSRSVKNVVKVGTNTMGCGLFGDHISYILPITGLIVKLPYKVFYDENFIEGIGHLPDYWLDDDDLPWSFIEWIKKIEFRD